MADTELLPCPFCGSSGVTIYLCEYGGHSAVCGNCEAEGPRVRSQEEAGPAWNKRYALASRPAEVDDWISVEDRLPGRERCLAAYVNAAGKHRIIRAMYAGQFQIDAGEDAIDQGNCEYNEADDTFYLKAGWLECIDNWDDYSSIYVTEGTVTHWRRLPAAPSHTTNKEK